MKLLYKYYSYLRCFSFYNNNFQRRFPMKRSTLLPSLLLSFFMLTSLIHATSKYATLPQLDMINSDLIKKDAKYKLVFFGYAGCYHFCDPRLHQIHAIYEELKNDLSIKMLFVDISLQTTYDQAEHFVKDVNVEFESINPDSKSMNDLQKKFQDVYVRKMGDGDYVHSGFLYLLQQHKQKYYLIKIYPEFHNTQAVINDIKKKVSQ